MTYQLPTWAKDFSDQGITDERLSEIISTTEFEQVRWLDLRFNQISRKGLEALCAAKLPELEAVAIFGNPCGDLRETFKSQGLDGDIVPGSIKPSALASELEATYGYKIWLHPLLEHGEAFPLPNNIAKLEPFFGDDVVTGPIEKFDYEDEEMETTHPSLELPLENEIHKLSLRHGELAMKFITKAITEEEALEWESIKSRMDKLSELKRQDSLVDYIMEGIGRLLDAKIDVLIDPKNEPRMVSAKNYLRQALKTSLEHYPRIRLPGDHILEDEKS
jgi:hypothetical protein